MPFSWKGMRASFFFFPQNKAPALWNVLHQLQKELQYIFLKRGMSQPHLLGVGVTFQNPTDSRIIKLNISLTGANWLTPHSLGAKLSPWKMPVEGTGAWNRTEPAIPYHGKICFLQESELQSCLSLSTPQPMPRGVPEFSLRDLFGDDAFLFPAAKRQPWHLALPWCWWIQ